MPACCTAPHVDDGTGGIVVMAVAIALGGAVVSGSCAAAGNASGVYVGVGMMIVGTTVCIVAVRRLLLLHEAQRRHEAERDPLLVVRLE